MIKVTKTYLPNLEKFKSYVDKIFASGWITNNGQYVEELEYRLKEYLHVNHILLLTNGTLALQVACKVLNLSGEAITTPFSFVATTSSLAWEGLKPVFVDIDPATFNIDAEQIEQAITPETSCIVPVHVFGNACAVEAIEQIARKYDLKVIYDAAHAFSVGYQGESLLNYGDCSILSFHATKIFHTIEGGALVTNSKELYERAKLMINFGIAGPESIVDLGINAKMNEFQAAMGLCVLDDLEEILHRRRQVYAHYLKALGNLETLQFQQHNSKSTENYAYFPIVFASEEILLKVMQALEVQGILPRRYFFPSLDTLPYVAGPEMAISKSIAQRILCLPIYDSLDLKIQEQIIAIIRENI